MSWGAEWYWPALVDKRLWERLLRAASKETRAEVLRQSDLNLNYRR